jgi:hypothetical protein
MFNPQQLHDFYTIITNVAIIAVLGAVALMLVDALNFGGIADDITIED